MVQSRFFRFYFGLRIREFIVYLLCQLGDGCLSSSIISLVDAFSIANFWHQNFADEPVLPLFETQIVSTDGKPVLAQGNVLLEPDMSIHNVDRTDCVVISPMLPDITPMPEDLDVLRQWLEKMKA
jgi:transcriptional regulator GlxA family with amidase domain